MKSTLSSLFAILIVLLFTSCGNETKEISITIVLDKPTEDAKYPSSFGEIAIPFTSNCKFDFLPKPINILRLDISNQEKKTNAWHFENIGENTVDFSKSWLDLYFKDSTNTYLSDASTRKPDVAKWIDKNKDKLYILCETCEAEKYNDIKVYVKQNEIFDAIKERACKEELKEIYVYYNPSILLESVVSNLDDTSTIIPPPSQPEPPKGEVKKPGGNGDVYVPPPPPKNCVDQVKPSTNELSELLALIANKSIDACRKTKLKSYLYNHFTSDAEIISVTNKCSENMTVDVSGLYSLLVGSGKSAFIQSQCENEMSGNKYRRASIQITR